MASKDEDIETLAEYDSDDEGVAEAGATKDVAKAGKDTYVGVHSSGFREFLLKPELLRAISDCGFEHPSEVQHEAIPAAILGTDVICQAKSGMGKTAVFVLSVLQQLNVGDGGDGAGAGAAAAGDEKAAADGAAGAAAAAATEHPGVQCLVMCHTRELAFQICHEFDRFKKYMPAVKTAVFYGGVPIAANRTLLKESPPHIVIGTPGRLLALVNDKSLKLDKLKHFVLDECDKMLEALDMRRDVQRIFRETPHEKQVMLFSATLSDEVRPVCKKFTHADVHEIYVNDGSKLTLHGLQQYYVELEENQKNRRLVDLLDQLEFNQLIIFVRSVPRARELNRLLQDCNFPSIALYGSMKQEQRIELYRKFKDFQARIMVATNLLGRGIDVERVNFVINYDMSEAADTYLHRVGRAGRFGTKGIAISFISSKDDAEVLNQVQSRFVLDVPELPDTIDSATYMTS